MAQIEFSGDVTLGLGALPGHKFVRLAEAHRTHQSLVVCHFKLRGVLLVGKPDLSKQMEIRVHCGANHDGSYSVCTHVPHVDTGLDVSFGFEVLHPPSQVCAVDVYLGGVKMLRRSVSLHSPA